MLDVFLYLLTAVIAVPMLIVCAEYLAACVYRGKHRKPGVRPPISVLIPAHNEEQPLARTLESIQQQLAASDTILVVADNCNDQTATIARDHAALVLERFDDVNLGKGFAIDAGLRFLEEHQKHGEAVVMIDADCTLDTGAIDHLVGQALTKNCPVQGTYLMHRPAQSNPAAVVSELAFTLKNHARALGDEVLGWPCILRGSGMAFPWPLLRDANVASDHIVEDVKIGLDFTFDGKAPRFCPEAFIRSELPCSTAASKTQRTRWEHGYLAMVSYCPRLLLRGLVSLRWQLIGTAAILAIPPLSLHCAAWVLGLLITIATFLFGWSSIAPFLSLFVVGCLFFACTMLAWFRFARHEIPFTSLLAIPGYVLSKLPIYLRFFTKREKKWVRTSRT